MTLSRKIFPVSGKKEKPQKLRFSKMFLSMTYNRLQMPYPSCRKQGFCCFVIPENNDGLAPGLSPLVPSAQREAPANPENKEL